MVSPCSSSHWRHISCSSRTLLWWSTLLIVLRRRSFAARENILEMICKPCQNLARNLRHPPRNSIATTYKEGELHVMRLVFVATSLNPSKYRRT
uniref:Putative secreted protein n=1 Tax=Ixodes ricinus TaxID=34613 RepID=A0A6B0UHG9_IXORI